MTPAPRMLNHCRPAPPVSEAIGASDAAKIAPASPALQAAPGGARSAAAADAVEEDDERALDHAAPRSRSATGSRPGRSGPTGTIPVGLSRLIE